MVLRKLITLKILLIYYEDKIIFRLNDALN